MTTRRRFAIACLAAVPMGFGARYVWDDLFTKRVAVVEPGRILRGAWQRPGPLRRLIAREKIRTVITLTAINRDDPKYIDQSAALEGTGVNWIIIPMRGSRATLEQMTEVADLLADPARQPVFFHCVGGHHRSNLVHAAYRIRHQHVSAPEAWKEVAALPWSRPERDLEDRDRIHAFARSLTTEKESTDEISTHPVGSPVRDLPPLADGGIPRDSLGIGQLRNR